LKYLSIIIFLIGCSEPIIKYRLECETTTKTIKQVVCANAVYDWVWSGTSCAKCRIEFNDGTRIDKCGPFLVGDKVSTKKCESIPIDRSGNG